MCDMIESNYLNEQVEAIKQIGDYITRLKRVGPGTFMIFSRLPNLVILVWVSDFANKRVTSKISTAVLLLVIFLFNSWQNSKFELIKSSQWWCFLRKSEIKARIRHQLNNSRALLRSI